LQPDIPPAGWPNIIVALIAGSIFGGVLSMATRSAGEHDWTFPRRFYRRGGFRDSSLKKQNGMLFRTTPFDKLHACPDIVLRRTSKIRSCGSGHT